MNDIEKIILEKFRTLLSKRVQVNKITLLGLVPEETPSPNQTWTFW